MSNVVINNSIVAGQFYQVDLADDAYGLKESFVYPFDIAINKNGDVSCIPTGYHVIANPEIVHENMDHWMTIRIIITGSRKIIFTNMGEFSYNRILVVL